MHCSCKDYRQRPCSLYPDLSAALFREMRFASKHVLISYVGSGRIATQYVQATAGTAQVLPNNLLISRGEIGTDLAFPAKCGGCQQTISLYDLAYKHDTSSIRPSLVVISYLLPWPRSFASLLRTNHSKLPTTNDFGLLSRVTAIRKYALLAIKTTFVRRFTTFSTSSLPRTLPTKHVR